MGKCRTQLSSRRSRSHLISFSLFALFFCFCGWKSNLHAASCALADVVRVQSLGFYAGSVLKFYVSLEMSFCFRGRENWTVRQQEIAPISVLFNSL